MFVLAIGMMGVLALFPLGAAQMANAVKDERCLQTAQMVEGFARIFWRNAYPSESTPDFLPPPPAVPNSWAFQVEPTLQAFYNPDPTISEVPGNPGMLLTQSLIDPGSTDASFPIFIDPIGRAFQPTLATQQWVGGVVSGPVGTQQGLPRRTIAAITNAGGAAAQNTARIRLFSLIDDLSFDMNGNTAAPMSRAGRYNAAFVLQRPINGGGTNHTRANLTVVVYQNRPVSDTPATETLLALGQQLTPGDTFVSFPKSGIPSLRKGSWILIHSQTQSSPNNVLHPIYSYANFYRIVSVQDNGANFFLEVSPPLKDNRPPNLPPNQAFWNVGGVPTLTYNANIFALDGVAEVFDRPMLMATGD